MNPGGDNVDANAAWTNILGEHGGELVQGRLGRAIGSHPRCGAVTEFTHERVDRMLGFLADEHGFLLQRHRVELHGLCRECQRRDLEPLHK